MDDTLNEEDIVCLDDMVVGVRLAAKIVDMPCSEMDTDAFISVVNNPHRLHYIQLRASTAWHNVQIRMSMPYINITGIHVFDFVTLSGD